jgi:hypothetical protein
MTTLREAAQRALDAMDTTRYAVADQATNDDVALHDAAMNALRAALAEPTCQDSRQVEPVAWMWEETAPRSSTGIGGTDRKLLFCRPADEPWKRNITPLYTTPPQRKPLQWHKAPVKTEWGEDMVESLVEIDKDHTLKLYCEHDQAARVEAMIGARKPLTDEALDQMFDQAGIADYGDHENRQRAEHLEVYSFGVRDAERAHGIGGKK